MTAMGNRRLGLIVDGLEEQRDVIVKALGPSLAGVVGFAGATDLGDQQVALVIDTPSIMRQLWGDRDLSAYVEVIS